MPGGGKDTLPAILANAPGSGLSETGPDQPQDQGIRVGLGENLLTSADCTRTCGGQRRPQEAVCLEQGPTSSVVA